MVSSLKRPGPKATGVFLSLAVTPSLSFAQEASAPGVSTMEEVVVSGSRIRRSQDDTASPVVAIDQQALTDRGFVSAADAVNQVTANIPALNQSSISGVGSGSGQQFANLFGLGAGRTLTLVNGRRFVASANGLGSLASAVSAGDPSSAVDTNIIPTGLIERVDVVQAGGAVVYGSDAIAGVINYVLRDDFEGVEFDAQTGQSFYGDYQVSSLRGTVGRNFAGGRGNVAINLEWSESDPLANADRPFTNTGSVYEANPADTGPSDGIPAVREIFNARFYEFNAGGVIFTIPAPIPIPPCGNQICFLRDAGGQALQFGAGGGVAAFDPGEVHRVPFSVGGDGYRLQDLSDLRGGVERRIGNLLGHFDLSDRLRLSTELLYAQTIGSQYAQAIPIRTTLGSPQNNDDSIVFFNTNPFLTSDALAALSAANPAFAAGAPLFLSKSFDDVLHDNRTTTTTDTYRGLLGLEGDFAVGDRSFYWSVSGSYGRVEGSAETWDVANARYNNAINAVRSGGTIACAINADSDPANDDPACAPLNPFGAGSVSDAARDYLNVRTGSEFVNEQIDFLATVGGDAFELPAGGVKFSAAYEHRTEDAEFTPSLANRLGLTGSGVQQVGQSGSYDTDEITAELLVPIVGRDLTLPLVQALELNGAGRHVDNSQAGQENLWSAGLRWQVVDGFALRGSRSRNFRAPSLGQLFTPSATNVATLGPGTDPCDADNITRGQNPNVRRANCLEVFQANPGYGVLPDGSNAGASAEQRLAGYQNVTDNFPGAVVTAGGNPDLRNEISRTLTYGIVLQPSFAPGLTLIVDRVEIDLTDGLSPFTTANFAAACFDSADMPAEVCDKFTRIAAPPGGASAAFGGTIVAGTTTTFNAGEVEYRGEVYSLNYGFRLASLGELELGVEATHTSLLTTSVTGDTFVRSDNSIPRSDGTGVPNWTGRFDVRYSTGPLRATYQLVYSDGVKYLPDATIESVPFPNVDSFVLHNISAHYELSELISVRAGINNFTDDQPFSSNGVKYGDVIGRQWFLGARVRF
jgi:iron complex outermembrane receptor protein